MTLAAVEKQPDRTWGGLLRRPWIVVVAVALVAGIFRTWAAFEIPLPWIMTDELIFRELATSFGRTGHFFVRGESIGLVSLYPVFLAPLWRAGSVALSFDLSKVLNVVAMTAASLLVYAWARRLVSTPYALATFALTLVMPAVLTQRADERGPRDACVVLSAFAIWRALQQPTWTNQAWALGSIVLVCAIRAQGVVLVPIWATAIALSAVLSIESVGRWRGSLRAFGPTGRRRWQLRCSRAVTCSSPSAAGRTRSASTKARPTRRTPPSALPSGSSTTWRSSRSRSD